MSGTLSIIDLFTEQNLALWLEKYRALGPLPGILLTFMKSFVPPLPTLVIVGLNAAVYGLWWGFLYSWIGLISGSMLTFLLVRKGTQMKWVRRWSDKPKVKQAMVWARRNGFNYVFLLSMLPVGPFVIVNIVAGLTRMSILSFLVAVALGKGVMVFCVSYIGTHLTDFMDEPIKLVGVVIFIIASLWLNRVLQRYFAADATRGSIT